MKTPEFEVAEKCLELRKQSKSGKTLSTEDYAFCAKIHEKFGDWYKYTEKQVFNETLPFGAVMSK